MAHVVAGCCDGPTAVATGPRRLLAWSGPRNFPMVGGNTRRVVAVVVAVVAAERDGGNAAGRMAAQSKKEGRETIKGERAGEKVGE